MASAYAPATLPIQLILLSVCNPRAQKTRIRVLKNLTYVDFSFAQRDKSCLNLRRMSIQGLRLCRFQESRAERTVPKNVISFCSHNILDSRNRSSNKSAKNMNEKQQRRQAEQDIYRLHPGPASQLRWTFQTSIEALYCCPLWRKSSAYFLWFWLA